MAKNSNIEWTHHTFNPWWGCAKVSPGCKNCYAESWAVRVGLQVWGTRSPRRFFGNDHWGEPILWNQEAKDERTRRRVFCASMADVFEDRRDLDEWRKRLWPLIEQTTWLDWLLLTKRPESVSCFVPWGQEWPRNVWLGTTVELQEWAMRRIPALLDIPAAIRFVSCEPLLGPVDLRPWLPPASQPPARFQRQSEHYRGRRYIDWVIAGGESGPKARPMHPCWAEGLRDQCIASGVPFHFKQWGHWRPSDGERGSVHAAVRMRGDDGKAVMMVKLGKKAAGRALGGRIWDGIPRSSGVRQE